eukprot:GHVU01073764.1.p2 GENE.GHVU01073764.1~~GHVU01073764.1.p2  ORF type:complete len:182 (-),score=44.37 GHVU01073764.1:492-1037(-)
MNMNESSSSSSSGRAAKEVGPTCGERTILQQEGVSGDPCFIARSAGDPSVAADWGQPELFAMQCRGHYAVGAVAVYVAAVTRGGGGGGGAASAEPGTEEEVRWKVCTKDGWSKARRHRDPSKGVAIMETCRRVTHIRRSSAPAAAAELDFSPSAAASLIQTLTVATGPPAMVEKDVDDVDE